MAGIVTTERSLAELEAVVENHRDEFMAVTAALLEIKQRRLYKLTHSSFNAYCEERFGLTGRSLDRQLAQGRAALAEPTKPVPSQRSLVKSKAKGHESTPSAPESETRASQNELEEPLDGMKVSSAPIDTKGTEVSPKAARDNGSTPSAPESETRASQNELEELRNDTKVLDDRALLAELIRRGPTAMANCTESAIAEGVSVLRNALVIRRSKARKPAPPRPKGNAAAQDKNCKHPVGRRLGTQCAVCGAQVK